jgi:multiple sugar transport system permease protein
MKGLGRVIAVWVAAMFVLFAIAPFMWQVLTSLRPTEYLTRLPPLLPPWLTLEHYRGVLSDAEFARFVLNSLVVAGLTTVLSLAVGAFGAFALAHLPIQAKGAVLGSALCLSMLPCVSILAPLFLIIRALGLRDTWWALVLTHGVFALPLTLWTLTHFFEDIPRELLKAALVDGLGPWGAFWRVYLPLSGGGLATCAILNFIFSWNEFLFALTFTTTDASRTVPVGVALFQGLHETPFGEIAAASVLVCIPVVVLAFVFQKGIVSGLTQGAVKG